ncbi:MAG: ribosome-associated translation inhibitor RaiA [Halioglobus sp.]|nr:ribosome-associated translation inhibitor RaiA [Halioglobus sp.]
MQLNITGHHLDVTVPLKEYVESKFERLQRHFDQISTTHVILSIDKLVQKAEATVHIAGGDLFAHAESEDMYAAIDALTDKLDRQLIKHKQKHRGH